MTWSCVRSSAAVAMAEDVTMVGKIEAAVNPESVLSHILGLLRVYRPVAWLWHILHLWTTQAFTSRSGSGDLSFGTMLLLVSAWLEVNRRRARRGTDVWGKLQGRQGSGTAVTARHVNPGP